MKAKDKTSKKKMDNKKEKNDLHDGQKKKKLKPVEKIKHKKNFFSED